MSLLSIKAKSDHILVNVYRLLLPLGILLLSQCNHKSAEQAPQAVTTSDNTVTLTDAQLKNTPVETTQLSGKNIATILKLNGKMDVPPKNLVSVSVPLGGYLKTTRLLPGMPVRKGEIIAVMEDPQYVRLQQDYLQAKSRLGVAELDYERQRELSEAQASSKKVMQQAQVEMNSQRITMNALAQQLRLVNIIPDNLSENTISRSVPVYSQLNGFVSKVNVNIGQYVNPADVMFELIDPADMHLTLKVYEKNIGRLRTGQPLIAWSNSDPGKKYTGKIVLISKDVGSDGVSDVHCHLDKSSDALFPGLYMNAEIEIRSSYAHALPEESVLSYEGKDYVFVQTGVKSFKLAPVVTGEKENGLISIADTTGFSNKNIVTKNAYTLLMELKNTSDEE